jgi:3-deoxy-D-arabino-heptulosonate 7-phosphate (DAHP) synthase class II
MYYNKWVVNSDNSAECIGGFIDNTEFDINYRFNSNCDPRILGKHGIGIIYSYLKINYKSYK